jgi:hypothetical protein
MRNIVFIEKLLLSSNILQDDFLQIHRRGLAPMPRVLRRVAAIVLKLTPTPAKPNYSFQTIPFFRNELRGLLFYTQGLCRIRFD